LFIELLLIIIDAHREGGGGRFGKRGYKNAMKRKNRFSHP
jgi:hypothetical protein